MCDYILEMRNITKAFSGVKALKDVTFQVKRGEIHALVGENGAGKSTLMKILSGVYPHGTYSGQLIFNGEERKFQNIRESEHAGIVIIYQELNIVPNLDVCENIFLGNELAGKLLIDRNSQNRKAIELLKRVKLDTTPYSRVDGLGVGKQQLIEIAKALNKDTSLLILDEPTAPLSEVDTENLFTLLYELKSANVTCVYISHKLSEIFTIADTVTVLRDGQTIVTSSAKDFTMESLVSRMVGRDMTQQFPQAQRCPKEIGFEVQGWSVENPDNPDKMLLEDVSLTVRRGEIVGIAGLVGAGRTELAMSLFGALPFKKSGAMFIGGKPVSVINPHDAIAKGLCYLTEDRKQLGLNLDFDIRENLSLACLPQLTKGPLIDENKELYNAEQMAKTLKIKAASLLQKVRNLSGGNQQKVVIGKWLLTNPIVFIMDEPTRGVDVGAKYEIYTLMNDLAALGVCVIMISSEMPEILGMSDRIYVMSEGKMSAEFLRHEATAEKILYYATGAEEGAHAPCESED